MNPVRVLLISNRYLFWIGCTVQKYSKKFNVYRRSIQGIVVCLLLNAAYLACLYEHYDKRKVFEIMRDFSKTMYYSMYLHLFIGMGSMCTILFDTREQSLFFNRVLKALPTNGVEVRWKFDRIELFAYYRTFVNLAVLICLIAYDLTIIDLTSVTRSKVMLFFGLYVPHVAIAGSFRNFAIQMVLLKNICQNLNKKLNDIELAYEFQLHGLYFEYLKSENIREDDATPTTSAASWTSSRPLSTVSTRFQDLKMQDSIFFQKWWSMVKHRIRPSLKMDVVQMVDAIQSDEYLLRKFHDIFKDYNRFMLMYRKLECLIQKQLILVVCQHTVVVMLTIHIFMEIYLEWSDLMNEDDIQLVKVNFTIHLLQILNDFVCLAITAILGRNEIRKTKHISNKLMVMPLCDDVRRLVSHFHFKLQNFKEDVYAFNMFKINGKNLFLVILQYATVGCMYAVYQYFDIKVTNLQSSVDSLINEEE